MAKDVTTSEPAADLRPYQNLQNYLAQRVELDGTNGSAFEIASQVIDLILNAEDEDALFAANESGPLDMERFLNRPLNFASLSFFKSAEKYRENGLGYYVVMDAIDDRGESVKLSTGAPNIVASMRKLESMGLIKEDAPYRCVIASRETANGNLYFLSRA